MKRIAVRVGNALQLVLGIAAVLAVLGAVGLMIGPRLAGWRPVVVLSGSMEPKLPVGGLVFLKPVEASQIRVGDIISFRHGNVRVTHRVAAVTKDTQGNLAFQTKGDANNDVDSGLVAPSSVDGREVFVVPDLGRVAKFMDSRTGFFAFIAIPMALIIAGELVNIGKQLNEQRSKPVA